MNDETEQLEQDIRGWYGQQRMSGEKLSALREAVGEAQRERRGRGWRWAAVAAGWVVVGIAIGVMMAQEASDRRALRAVAAEVVWDHQRGFGDEVGVKSFAELQSVEGLGFRAVEPERCKKEKYVVKGAKVCRIGGASGVMIRLAEDSGEIRTLCEFKGGEFAEAAEGEVKVEGVEVSVWREGGVVMGMTGEGP